MPEILPAALKSAESTEAAAAIIASYQNAVRLRDRAVETAALACRAALECGELLLREKERQRGVFLLWLKWCCPQIKHSTAAKYMRIARLRRELGDQAVDLRTIKDWYISAGLLPPRTAPEERFRRPPYVMFWAYTKRIDLWMPQLPEPFKPRVRTWWTDFGKRQNWL